MPVIQTAIAAKNNFGLIKLLETEDIFKRVGRCFEPRGLLYIVLNTAKLKERFDFSVKYAKI